MPTLYVVPYAHLDTQWRWEFPQTISEYLLKTMRVNFDYIDKYPHYVFNWTGANRYRLMKEYFPHDYARMKQYVAAGPLVPGRLLRGGRRRQPSQRGRHLPPGALWQRHTSATNSARRAMSTCCPIASAFPRRCPAFWRTPGVKGFSTQKLNAGWQPAPQVGGPDSPEQTPEGIPFNVGIWIGPDGKTVIAALNPGSYGSNVYTDLSKEPPHLRPSSRRARSAKLTPQRSDG